MEEAEVRQGKTYSVMLCWVLVERMEEAGVAGAGRDICWGAQAAAETSPIARLPVRR